MQGKRLLGWPLAGKDESRGVCEIKRRKCCFARLDSDPPFQKILVEEPVVQNVLGAHAGFSGFIRFQGVGMA